MTDKLKSNTALLVTVKSKDSTLYSGPAATVTSTNDRGIFDILPFHTNFITLINKYVILDKGLSSEKRFDLEKGVMYVMANKIDVYVGI